MNVPAYIIFVILTSVTVAFIFCQIQIARKKQISLGTFFAGLFTATIVASVWTAFVRGGIAAFTYHYWKTQRAELSIAVLLWFTFFISIIPGAVTAIWFQKRNRQPKIPLIIASGLLIVLCVLLIPSFISAHSTSSTNACINNLRIIDAAKEQWALENNKSTNDTPVWNDIQPYLGRSSTNKILQCPDGGIYTIGKIGQLPTCSIEGHSLSQ
jgi:glucan phosphoethanolaminetransferase (alkaline phosphatase superfamily)